MLFQRKEIIMLRIITGTEHSSKTRLLAEMAQQSIKSGRHVCIIIPDQFSLVYDRKIYGILGAKAFNKMAVIGPNKLSKRLIEQYGSSGRYCSDDARLIMMYKACKEFSSLGGARYFKRSLTKCGFFANACDTVDELRQSAVDCNALLAAAEQLSGTASDKLYDIAKIYELYTQQLEKYGLKDSSTAVSEAAEIIRKNGIFKGCDVYFDSFSSFTADQQSLLYEIFAQAENITFALTIGKGRNADIRRAPLSPYAECISTKKRLEELAVKIGIKVQHTEAEEENINACVRAVADNVFAPAIKTGLDGEGVTIANAADVYAEAEYVFAEIRRLVRDEGYTFGDIAIISRDLANAADILEDMAYRYDVPLFIDQKNVVARSSPAMFINAVFENITSKTFHTRSLLTYIKSPFSSISTQQASMIEEYAFKWSVEGDMWLHDFTASDEGSQIMREKELEELNFIRRKIIEPLAVLKEKCREASAKEIYTAFNEFLNSQIEDYDGGNDEDVSKILEQLWKRAMEACESIYMTLGDEKIGISQYRDLLKTMLLQTQISSPPQRLDAVIAAGAEHSRLPDIRAVFVIGVNDGLFPKNVKLSGLFTEREKARMEKADIHMEKRLDTNLRAERFACMRSLGAPSEKLYICIPRADKKGDALSPSQLALQIKGMFTKDISVSVSQLGTEFFCVSPKSAIYKYSELIGKDRAKASAIKAALLPYPEYAALAGDIERELFGKKAQHKLSKNTAKELFLKKGLSISATAAETFFSCPFGYFCKYGMGIKSTRKVDMASANIGLIAHKCFEKIAPMLKERPGMTKDELQKEVDRCTEEYIEKNMGGDFGKNAAFRASVEAIKDQILLSVMNIQKELETPGINPIFYEYKLSDGGRGLSLKSDTEGLDYINLYGIVDRVDEITTKDGKRYIRVVDYKTGKKVFNYESIYHGLDLQMLLYLYAVLESADDAVKGASPAGVIYVRAGEQKEFMSKGDILSIINKALEEGRTGGLTPQQISKLTESKLGDAKAKLVMSSMKRSGVVADDIELVKTMAAAGGGYSPVALTAKNEYHERTRDYVLSVPSLEKLEQFAVEKIKSMAKDLAAGKIDPMPVGAKDHLPCAYCDYKAICSTPNRDDAVIISKDDKEKLLAEIQQDDGQPDERS